MAKDFSFKQEGFSAVLIIAVLGILGLIAFLLLSGRDFVAGIGKSFSGGEIGSGIGKTAGGVITGFFGSLKDGISSGWNSFKNWIGGSGPTGDQGETL